MKIRKWVDLNHEILKTDRGLEVETILYCSKFVPRVCLEGRLITCIDWATDLEEVVGILYKFGFDVEYEEPFNLVEFLKENIEPTKFNCDKDNWCFKMLNTEIIQVWCCTAKCIGTFYFKSKTEEQVYILEKKLKEEKVTPMQLLGALEELGWL